MRVPSLDTAEYCSATRLEASNLGGCWRIWRAAPVPASTSHCDGGVRKLVTPIKARSSVLLVSATLMVELSGISSEDLVQVPRGPGLNSKVRPRTLSRIDTISMFLVALALCSAWRAVGA